MNKKSIVVIISAVILAFVVSLLCNNKQDVVKSSYEDIKKEEIITEEVENIVVEEKNNKNNDVSVSYNKIVETAKPIEAVSEPLVESVKIQEATIVQEVEPDYGVRVVDDTVEVTREFKLTSHTTYSFKDFGFLYKVK